MRLKDVDIIIDYYILHICYVMLCVYSIYIYRFSTMGGTPSHHPFDFRIFHYKPAIFGYPHSRTPPYIYIHRCTVYSSRQKIHVYIYIYAHMYSRHNACVCIYIYIYYEYMYLYIYIYIYTSLWIQILPQQGLAIIYDITTPNHSRSYLKKVQLDPVHHGYAEVFGSTRIYIYMIYVCICM